MIMTIMMDDCRVPLSHRSLQSAGLYYGNWVNQQIARNAGGDPNVNLLVAETMEPALDLLGFTYVTWPPTPVAQPQSTAFFAWIRSNIIAKYQAV